MTDKNLYQAFCDSRMQAQLTRELRDTQVLPKGRAARDGKVFVNFAGNDYLGLTHHTALIARVQEYAARNGTGSGASRLVTGNASPHAVIEKKLAAGKNAEAVLIMNSGYQANVTVLAALADTEALGKSVTILADRLAHNSLIQGAVLSGARFMRFHHNDYAHLEELLKRESDKDTHVIIVSESVFSMDGDRADLTALIALKKKYGAMLYIDEAHATGVLGKDGFGLSTEHPGEIDVVMGTFGKALGSFGAYVATNAVLRDYLVQRCGGLIYSTALPPMVLGAMDAALDLLPSLESERAYVAQQAERVRDALKEQGWDCGVSTTQIIPVILGGEGAALALAQALEEKGVIAVAIRPPTVPRGTSRLRISLSAAHAVEDINYLIAAMAEQATAFTAPQALAS